MIREHKDYSLRIERFSWNILAAMKGKLTFRARILRLLGQED